MHGLQGHLESGSKFHRQNQPTLSTSVDACKATGPSSISPNPISKVPNRLLDFSLSYCRSNSRLIESSVISLQLNLHGVELSSIYGWYQDVEGEVCFYSSKVYTLKCFSTSTVNTASNIPGLLHIAWSKPFHYLTLLAVTVSLLWIF